MRTIAELRNLPLNATEPAVPGFYWAKWRVADQGCTETAAYEAFLPLNTWDVVEVFKNMNFDITDALRVFVSGVADSQSLENFFWGPGPLLPPPT